MVGGEDRRDRKISPWPVVNIGRGDEQLGLRRPGAKLRNRQRTRDDRAERIEVERVEVIGRRAFGRARRAQGWRGEELPGAEPDVEQEVASLPLATPSWLTESQKSSSFWRAPSRPPSLKSAGKHDGVHRAGAGSADAGNLDPLVLEQGVQRAPGERAVRSAALQCEVDAPGEVEPLGRGPPSRSRSSRRRSTRFAPVICAALSEQR